MCFSTHSIYTSYLYAGLGNKVTQISLCLMNSLMEGLKMPHTAVNRRQSMKTDTPITATYIITSKL